MSDLFSDYSVSITGGGFDEVLSGWASLMASIWLLGGMIIAFLGIIGIYLSKIFLEVKRRPLSIIRQIYFKG